MTYKRKVWEAISAVTKSQKGFNLFFIFILQRNLRAYQWRCKDEKVLVSSKQNCSLKIKEDLNEKTSHVYGLENIVFKIVMLFKLTYTVIFIKILSSFLAEIGKPIVEITWKCRVSRIAKKILKKNKFWEHFSFSKLPTNLQ